MSKAAALIREARSTGIGLRLDGPHVLAYSHRRPPDDLIDRLRAAAAAIRALLRAEEQLLAAARNSEHAASQELLDPTIAVRFVAAGAALRAALGGARVYELDGRIEAWEKALPAIKTDRMFSRAHPDASTALEDARQRLLELEWRNPHLRRPTWEEFEPVEYQRRGECDSGGRERGLAAVHAWEQALILLMVQSAQPEIAQEA